MSIFDKRDNKKTDESKENKQSGNFAGSMFNSVDENKLLNKIETNQRYAETGGQRGKIEKAWHDEYLLYQGGGKQWDTSVGFRSEKGKKRNFNSEDNFVFPMVQNIVASLTVRTPIVTVGETEPQDKDAADVLKDLLPAIAYRNKFTDEYKKIVEQFVKYGPAIGYVAWDQHWIGGSGPNKWVGEIKMQYVKKNEFFPDPAIVDLETRLQDCSFINLKQRKKIDWIKDTWKEKSKYVIEDSVDIPEGDDNEGPDSQQATLITSFHKGVPAFISKEWKADFLKKAEEAEAAGLPYKARDFRDMAKGTLKGVHCAYKVGAILLDYVPYIYDDGLYPFVYRVEYTDEGQPYGMGENRNVMSPQIMHNKVDEIEVMAMLGQGLGGGFYTKAAMSNAQRDEFLDNVAKPNVWHQVNNIHEMEPRKAVQVPSNIINYKNSKRDIVDTITGNTAILQGISPGANVPYATIKDLGARSDLRMKCRANTLSSFLVEMYQLVINRIGQFYTEERTYRVLGDRKLASFEKEAFEVLSYIAGMPQGTAPEVQIQAMIELMKAVKLQKREIMTGQFKREMLVKKWQREIMTDETGAEKPLYEEFIPEFDIRAKAMDERPSDPDYYIEFGMNLFAKGAMGLKALWRTITDGKFPTMEEVIAEIEEMQQAQQQAQQAQIEAQQQAQQQQQEYGVKKQAMQNESVEKQVNTKAMANMLMKMKENEQAQQAAAQAQQTIV